LAGEAEVALSDASWVKEQVAATADSVVLITVEGRDGQQAGLGTGFVVSADGLIATNLHVIGQARPITVRFRDGRELPVTEIHATDQHLDLAIVRVAAQDLHPLPLQQDGQRAPQGQPIIALGNPMGLRHSVVVGVVSGYREIDGREMVQIAMPIEPGNSGGPLLDRSGQVLGIVTLKSAVTANLGFAIQAAALRDLLAKPNPIAMVRWQTIGALNASDWATLFGARWRQRSGRIVVSEPGSGFGGRSLCLWNAMPPDEGPYEVGVFVKLSDEAGAAGLVFGADGDNRHYGFYPSAGRLRLTRFDGPTIYQWQVLDEREVVGYRQGAWNHLKLRIDGDRLEAFVNDQPALSIELPDRPVGRVGLAKFRDTAAEFKQFQLAEKLPASQVGSDRLVAVRPLLDTVKRDEPLSAEARAALLADPQASREAMLEQAEQLRQQAERLTRWSNDVHVHATCRELADVLNKAEQTDAPQTDAPQTDAPQTNAPQTDHLIRAALLVSKLDNVELSVDAYVDQVRRLGDEIRKSLDADATDPQRLAALNRYLFQENGFHGSRTNYYQAANSYFDRMLDDREGLPITLSILYLELARQLGLTMEGVGLPGHFVVRYVPKVGDARLIDVFDGGTELTLEMAKEKTESITGVAFRQEDIQSSASREIVLRILRNLLALAQQRDDREPLLRYLEAMVAIAPDEPQFRGMRAVVRHQTGRREGALEDLDWFLTQTPAGIDLETIRAMRDRFQAN
jgi:regulator of sirC expression with transglutaminase-like and TPR domain